MLAADGAVVVLGWLPDWLPAAPDRVRERLGRDWPRYRKIAHPRVRQRFLAARLLLRHAAAVALDSPADSIDLAYQPGGRPYLRGCDQIDVNLSHTDQVLVVGLHRRGRIGADVERADRPAAGAEAGACTPYERWQLARVTGSARNLTLLRIWTLKEAYSKAVGQGLRLRFTEFGFDLSGPAPRLVGPDGSAVDDGGWTFHSWRWARRYLVGVAAQASGFGEGSDIVAGTGLDEGLLGALREATAPAAR